MLFPKKVDTIDADVVAIGAGQTAVPLVRALAAAGQRTVLVESDDLGGSCVNFGCTPSKAALAPAQRSADARDTARFGVSVSGVEIDFGAVMSRARGFADRGRAHLDGLFEIGTAQLVRGHGRLWGRDGQRFRVIVDDGPTILADRVVLDTGTRTIVPPIPGIDVLPIVTAENWLDLDQLPEHLIVLGSGAVGLEMAQLYHRLGAEVTIVERSAQIAPHEDADVASVIAKSLVRQGIAIRTGIVVRSAEQRGGHIVLRTGAEAITGTHLFVATGRRASIADLGLDSIGLSPAPDCILAVDEHLETAVKGVFAAGDIRGGLRFTQTAWDDHRVLLANFGDFPPHTTRRVVPYAIFTDPEFARVGVSEREAKEQDIDHIVMTTPYSEIAKAREIGRERGMIKLIVDPNKEKLHGAVIVGENASELIHIMSLLMHLNAPLSAIRSGIFTHPTLGEGLQSAVSAVSKYVA